MWQIEDDYKEKKVHFMRTSMYARCLSLAAVISLFISGYSAEAAPQPPQRGPAGYNDSGVQLNRTRQYLEQQRVQQRIAEGRDTSKVEGETTEMPEEPGKGIRFVLKRIETPPSAVLTGTEITAVTAPYMGTEISIQDLYTIVEKINDIYSAKGFMTCRAFLTPQTIKDGIVHIDLVEGRTQDVAIDGNKTTRGQYIRQRIPLESGKIANISKLNERLLLFNATNDVQLRIAMKAGEEYGTTDYVITAYEPQKNMIGIFSDNAGSETSGFYRGGLFFQNKSLTGNRDSLMLTSVFSKGTKSVAASYLVPINTNGTKLGFNYSTNSVHIIDGPLEPLNVKGHSNAYSLSLTQPLKATETVKTEAGLEYGYQNSKTDFSSIHWVDDTIRGLSLFIDQIDYGKTTVFYQKHAYRIGNYTDITDQTRRFGKYNLTTLFQKSYASGQMLTLRLDGQISSTQYLPSAEQFYIGGMYSVRGYTESLLGGDGGVLASAEYTFPLTPSKRTSGYVFLDGGRVWGESAFDDTNLIGTGFGVKTTISDHASVNVGMGFPLIRTINDAEQSRARVHFSFNSQF